jgi:hypothetical protein
MRPTMKVIPNKKGQTVAHLLLKEGKADLLKELQKYKDTFFSATAPRQNINNNNEASEDSKTKNLKNMG